MVVLVAADFFVWRRRGRKSAPNAQFGSEIVDEKSVHRKTNFGRFSSGRSCPFVLFVFFFGCFWSPRAAATRTNANGRPQHVQINFWGVPRSRRPAPARENAKTRTRTTKRPFIYPGLFFGPGAAKRQRAGIEGGSKLPAGWLRLYCMGPAFSL